MKKSKDAFRRLVKTKAKEYALKILLEKKSKHSKMDNINYRDLKIQDYLVDENLTSEEMKTIFKYRTRMEDYGENFRGGETQVMCPLCSLHLDNQELSFQCQVIKNEVKITGDIQNIFKDSINVETVKTICKISEYRKRNKLKK